jgi:hypothetical protein
MHSNVAGPFGLTFSPTTIFASRFNALGSIEITRYPASSDYQKYYHDAVNNFESETEIDKPEADVKAMFHDAFAFVTESLSEQLGHDPEFSSLFIPSVFQYKVRNAAVDAIFLDADRSTKAGLARQAACYGFGFLDCKNLGRTLKECNEDSPESSIVVLEYEKEYLYAFFMEVGFDLGTYYVHLKKFCKDCGEEYRQVSLISCCLIILSWKLMKTKRNLAHKHITTE